MKLSSDHLVNPPQTSETVAKARALAAGIVAAAEFAESSHDEVRK